MAEEITFESLGLKKPLEKMTAKELRELCIEKIPPITGASGKSKEELIAEIKELFNLEGEGENKVSPYKETIWSIKREIRDLREARTKAESRQEKERIRKKINKLKKRTRRLSASL